MAANWWQRMKNALREGWRTAYSTYRQEDYVPIEALGWDDYKTRLNRYWQFRMYADNTVFTAIQQYAEQQKKDRKLYRHIRSIYNPVSRLIDLEVAKVYGGNIDYAGNLMGGAIPIISDSEELTAAITQLFKWSNMGRMKNRYVRTGATYGDSVLKVVDDRVSEKVRLEVVDPRKLKEVKLDEVGNVQYAVFEYPVLEEGSDKEFIYREEIDKEQFRTYKDGELFGYYLNGDGDSMSEWANEYGFVPVRLAAHKDVGLTFASTSFNASLSKIDETNDLASQIHDGIRKTVNAPWGVSGEYQMSTNAKGEKKATSNADQRDEQPFIKLPKDATAIPLMMPLDIPGYIQALKELISELERDIPQLSLQRIRDRGGDVSGVAVKNMYSDASDLIIETQGNYDSGMVAAVQMAISIGGLRRYSSFETFNLNSYNKGDLDFTVKERPVFADEFSRRERVDLLLAAADSPALTIIMRELDYSEDQITEVARNVADREAAAMRGLADAAFGSAAPEDDDDDLDEDVSDEEA